jgi:hypothetical protein
MHTCSKSLLLTQIGSWVNRFAEMQEVWKNDSFLRSTATKRRPQSFHRIFATLHAIEASEQR